MFRKVKRMTTYVVIVCGRCGRYLLAKDGQKTRSCAYCGHTVILEKAKRVSSARTIGEALKLISKTKSNAGSKKRSINDFTHF